MQLYHNLLTKISNKFDFLVSISIYIYIYTTYQTLQSCNPVPSQICKINQTSMSNKPKQPKYFSYFIVALYLCAYFTNQPCVSAATVRITNTISNMVLAECVSNKDNFGVHNLTQAQYVEWNFTPDFLGRTKISCDFIEYGTHLVASFEVYNEHTLGVCVKWRPLFSDTCYWEVRDDGFYFNHYNDTNPPTPWDKKYDWR